MSFCKIPKIQGKPLLWKCTLWLYQPALHDPDGVVLTEECVKPCLKKKWKGLALGPVGHGLSLTESTVALGSV